MAIRIRKMLEADIEYFPIAFMAQGWHKPKAQFAEYFLAQNAGEYRVFVAEMDSRAAGYVLLKQEATYGPYAGRGISYIEDFNVLQKYQKKGCGSALLDAAECAAAKTGASVCLGVGLHAGYGAAQRIYAKRGYIPDGSGVWYQNAPLAEGAACANDDELVLYMQKTFAPL